jgi:hypothetical protein
MIRILNTHFKLLKNFASGDESPRPGGGEDGRGDRRPVVHLVPAVRDHCGLQGEPGEAAGRCGRRPRQAGRSDGTQAGLVKG